MAEILVPFSVAADVEAEPEVDDRVGRIYEVGLNGKGYMLYDNRDSDGQRWEYRRAVIPLDPPRLATSDTPFSEAIERYTFQGWSGFEDGAGQRFANRPRSSPVAYWDSEGINPFDRSGLELLPAMSRVVESAFSGLQCRIAGEVLYALTDNDEVTYIDGLGGTAVTVNVTTDGVTPVTEAFGFESDGRYWYLAAGSEGIFRGTDTDPGAAWSAVEGEVIGYHAQRLCVGLSDGASATPNRFTTLGPDGAEEVPGGRLDLPDGWTITGFGGGGGFVWFGAHIGDRGYVYVWDISDDTPTVALELPAGEIPRKLFWYQGQLYLRSMRATAEGGSQALIYRCLVGPEGTLDPFLVTILGDDDTDVNYGDGSFTAIGRRVIFSWPYREAGSGTGAIDVTTGGYAPWVKTTVAAPTRCLSLWQGRIMAVAVGDGVWVESDTLEEEGWLRTSIADGASTIPKSFDEVTLQFRPLGPDQSIEVRYTTDSGDSYQVDPVVNADSLGTRSAREPIGVRGQSIGLEITLKGPGTSSPILQSAQVRFHPVGLADELVVLPIDCSDYIRGMSGAELDGNGPGAGVARFAELHALVQSEVWLQDVDWHLTSEVNKYEVVGIDAHKWSVYDTAQGQVGIRIVAEVTLRRRLR